MDFQITFSPELEAFRDEVGAWLDANNPQFIISSDPRDTTEEDDAKRIAFRKALGDKGWLYALGPKKYGGGGLTMDHAIVIHQELEKRHIYGAGGGDSMMAACILVWGTEEQKKTFAEPLLNGQKSAMLVLTEPQGGSDLASTRTRAIRDGDDYVVNGQKIFVGGDGPLPEHLWTIVMTDPNAPRHRNLSYLMIPSDAPGITYQPLNLLSSTPGMADRNVSAHKLIIFFDDVRVPAFNLIGGENEGWKVAATNMELEHGGGGTIADDLNYLRALAVMQEMQYEGTSLIKDPNTREVLAELVQEREILRLFGSRNFWIRHSKTRMEHEGPQLTYWRKVKAHSLAQKMVDLLGHYPLQRDPKYMVAEGWLELFQRSVYATVHAGGGLNIQATIIARRLGVGRNTVEEAGALPSTD